MLDRSADNIDRRNSILNLTIEGWKVYDQIAPEAVAFEASLKGSLDEREAAELDTLLSKLMDKATNL